MAIDIAKARHEVLIALPGKKRRRRLTILNQLDDFKRWIASWASYGLSVRVTFDATGNYHRAIAYHLAAAGFEMKLVSSVSWAHTREALQKSWDKNDTKDARVILHMMEMGTRSSTTTHWHAAPTTFRSCPKPMTSSLNSRCPSSGFFEQM